MVRHCCDVVVFNVLLKVMFLPDPPSVPTIGSSLYSVESAFTGSVTLNISSMSSSGAAVSYNASVTGGSGRVTVTDNIITVTGLNYTQTHNVTLTAVYECSGIDTSALIPVPFNTAGM